MKAIASTGPSYRPPGYEALRTTLLDHEKATLEKSIEKLCTKEIKVGCTVTIDGWSNTNNIPLLNILLVTPKGEWFVNALDTSGHFKLVEYIATEILKSIELVGPDNVVQIITDNAANCKAVEKQLEDIYPHITWSGCVAHIMDLCLEDVGKIDWARFILKQGSDIVKFIGNHHKSLAIFISVSILQLLKPTKICFARAYIILERLLMTRLNLEETVTCQAWREWVISTSSIRVNAENVKEKILSNTFWKDVQELVDLSLTMLKVLHLANSSLPTTAKLYRALQVAALTITTVQFPNFSVFKQYIVVVALQKRCEFIISDIHYVGYVLDLEYINHSQGDQIQVVEDWLRMVDKCIPNLVDRVKCLTKLAIYKNGGGIFSREIVKQTTKEMSGYQWWKEFGSTCPIVQQIAIRILAHSTKFNLCL